MKKYIIPTMMMFMGVSAVYSQSVQIWTENFDSNTVSFSSMPANAWSKNNIYYVNGSSSYRGVVPSAPGDSVILTTSVYDFRPYEFVQLRFNHICKISPMDRIVIEYKLDGQGWKLLPAFAYMGKANNYDVIGFNAESYLEWQADDSTVMPTQSWWKEEVFDLSYYTSFESGVQFRFILKHGKTPGTQISYGWLLDNFEITAATYEIKFPVVELFSSLVRDTVYGTGWEISAKVKTATAAPINIPCLKYTAKNSGVVIATDSIFMTNVDGDSLWKANIPQFTVGTEVFYSVSGKDTIGNYTTVTSWYYIKKTEGDNYSDHSVAIFSIDTKDSTVVMSNTPVPVVVTLKNKGDSNLTSATIYYSINGNPTQQHSWKGNLPWDFNAQDTIDYYIPELNKRDTFTVWVKLPNEVNDNITNDDTLSKVIYGSSDIVMEFVTVFSDTIYDTGTFPISARVRTLLGTSVSSVFLNTITTYAGISISDTFPMNFDVTDKLWKTNLPEMQYNSNIVYSITMTDTFGNMGTIIDSFYVQRLQEGPGTGYVTIGTGRITNYESPINLYYRYNFSRQLYLGTDFFPDARGGTITKLAWNYAHTATWNHDKQTCYFRAVDDNVISTSAYVNPLDDGATLVWQGSTGANGSGWVEITLDQSFVLPPGKNLLIYWNNEDGNDLTISHTWNHTNTAENTTVYGHNDNSFSAAISSGTFSNERPNARFYVVNEQLPLTSVALEVIESPFSNVMENMSTVVQARIRNKGTDDLDSCVLSWARNGILQQSVTFHGKLPDNFTELITVGNYIPVAYQRDTIAVWVSMPNGITDKYTFDDTLQITVFGCSQSFDGIKTVGTEGDFQTLNAAINVIRECGMTGDLTLQLEGTFEENVDLQNLTPYMNGYHLTITSLDNHPDSAIIKSSGAGIMIGKTNNVTLKNITVDAIKGTYGIQFTDACTNVLIRDCYIFTDSTKTSTGSASPIFKGQLTGVADSIFIINNQLNGGNYGCCFYGGTSSFVYGTHIVFDSNRVSNSRDNGIYLYYVDLTSCSYNTVLSRTEKTYSYYQGFVIQYTNGPVTANRVIQRSTEIKTPYGMSFSNYNNTTDTGLIANNEIIVYIEHTTGNYSGISIRSSRARILHNSVYVSGTGAARGIQINDNSNNWLMVKNNNIIMKSAEAFPVYLNLIDNLSNYDMDYNNMYAPTYAGYAGANKTTIAEWQRTITTDHHSGRILPNINPAIGLEPSADFGLVCNALPMINQDIQGVTRTAITTMGCYELTPATVNATLKTIDELREGHTLGQTDAVKITVTNTGSTPLASLNLGWSVNDVIQSNNLNYTVSLLWGQSDTLSLGQVNYIAGKMIVKVWINNLNGGNLSDLFAEDDTLSTSVFICNGNHSGMLTIGATGDFQNMKETYDVLNLCGVNGDITLAFQTGTHIGNLDLTNSIALFGNYSLTLTSLTGNASDVTFSTPVGAVIHCNNTNNLVIKDITLDATKGTYGIHFTGKAHNITVENCRILANPAATGNAVSSTPPTSAGICKAVNTDLLDGLTVKNCSIDGGHSGVYLYGETFNYCQNIVIDNDSMTNQYYYGIYLYYVNANSISYNQIRPRSADAGETWQALYANSLRNGGNIIGNRISVINPNPAINSNLTGIYLYYTDSALVANNEIYLNSNANTTRGIYVNYPRQVHIINNTVYTIKSGTSGTNNHALYSSTEFSATIKNNIFVASGEPLGSTYAVYFSGTNAAFKTNYNVDYNDYYSSGTNIGYVAGASRKDLAAWKTAITPLDFHSVNIFPDFIDPINSLMLGTYPDSLLCPKHQHVNTDIRNIPRPENTAMGANTQFTIGQDLMLKEVPLWYDEVVYNQTAPVNVVLYNLGTLPITDAVFGWSVNGETKQSVSWTATSNLNSLEECVIHIGSFQVTNTTNYDIVVWIDSINGKVDTVKWNDTVTASASLKPLAEFADPSVEDTIISLSFKVNTIIRQGTGATINTPVMTIVSTVHEKTTLYDTVPLTLNNGIWQATIPPQYYGTKVMYSLSLEDLVGNNITLIDSTYICSALSILGDSVLMSTLSLKEPRNTTGCMLDSTSVKVALTNKGNIDFNFSKDTILLEVEIIDPDTIKYTASVPFAGVLQSGENVIELMSALPTIHPGEYHIKAWISSPTDNVIYKDTLYYTYISGKVKLPVDENFSNGIPLIFDVRDNNTSAKWILAGANTDVEPYFGDSMLSFTANMGAMCTFATRQMDLSRTIKPALSFWYFHDTIPSEDYTDVRIAIDGENYSTLLSLSKYDASYGWKQYSMDLPSYFVNQCVILVFEAMGKSRSENVTQYIDRIRITAKQDIAVTEILTSEYNVCDLENKDLKVILSNFTAPVLNYLTTPVILTLEIKETGQIFSDTLIKGSLGSFSSDTITLATDFNFDKGAYTFKAYFSSVLDDTPLNDTLIQQINIDPKMSVSIQPESSPANCLTGEFVVYPTVTIYNEGNMDLCNVELIFQIDTGDIIIAPYILFKEICTDTIPVGMSHTYTFKNSYTVPWKADYHSRITAYLLCDSTLIDTVNTLTECVNTKDLYVISIGNPSSSVDKAGSSIQVRATIGNHSDLNTFAGLRITVLVTNSQGIEMAKFTEMTGTVGTLATVNHNFTNSYTVPNDTVYYLTVYIDNYDIYPHNDTVTITRYTDGVGIIPTGTTNVFALGQNIPNPANNNTRIDYSVPEAGEVVFYVHSISGQLLYSKTIETERGAHSIELNTSTFAAGVYFYSMEYKGQRLIRQLIISN
jgi:hypothetical protein